MFRCPASYPAEPRGHTPPALLFPSSTMSNSREALSLQNTKPTKIQPVSLSGTTGVSASTDMNSRQNGRRFGQRRVPQWPLYRSHPLRLSSVCCTLFCNCGMILKYIRNFAFQRSFQQLFQFTFGISETVFAGCRAPKFGLNPDISKVKLCL